ncbi:hypothetical protein [Aminobacter sp. MSH1]|uniref:hypothetical protein n=1 Tax=Aminobacter sp. MSH1 TaxID=374606 RepID=UPI00131F4234|nr:hypothetical protein [Aminobacter sp. MSH1]
MTPSDKIALAAVAISLVALLLSIHFWRRSFRPIVTAMVRSNKSGNLATAFDLVLLNSGSIPARSVTLHITDDRQLENALDKAPLDRRSRFLSCFLKGTKVPILHNGAEVSCSFGYVSQTDSFWKGGAEFPILVRYEGWFGKIYVERQTLRIVSSTSFTDFSWGTPNAT